MTNDIIIYFHSLFVHLKFELGKMLNFIKKTQKVARNVGMLKHEFCAIRLIFYH